MSRSTQPDSSIPDRLAALRGAMQDRQVTACLIPGSDPHLSEYLPEHWQARAHFSGFDGSAGTLLVTADFAGLWTDSRYFEQAGEQLAGTGVTLMKMRTPGVPTHEQWLQDNLQAGDILAVDGFCLALTARRRLQSQLADIGARLRTDHDLPGRVWADRPGLPAAPIYPHPPAYALTPRGDKLARVRETMQTLEASHHLISTLDDIAWLTNLRGADVAYNPVFLAHLLIEPARCLLFVDEDKIDAGLRRQLADDGIELAAYGAVSHYLSQLAPDTRLLYDPERVVAAVADAVASAVTGIEKANPATTMKAVKTDGELAHIRQAMHEDGAALVGAFRRLEQGLAAGQPLTELDVHRLLYEQRSARPGFVSESFATIAGYRANAALPHYRATPAQHATLAADDLLLVDSGGQYLTGTTDITRIWAFGRTTQEQRHDATIVLKGLIQLSRARFPVGASGEQLDALARAPIWAAAADYGHGTGHGVGYFLNVHDGPQGFRPPRVGSAMPALEPGMITSIEPGLYKPGRHGIRHENLVAVRDDSDSEFGAFRALETLTLCPIDTRALEPALLDAVERRWLNDYHARVMQELLPLLPEEADREWLCQRCRAL